MLDLYFSRVLCYLLADESTDGLLVKDYDVTYIVSSKETVPWTPLDLYEAVAEVDAGENRPMLLGVETRLVLPHRNLTIH